MVPGILLGRDWGLVSLASVHPCLAVGSGDPSVLSRCHLRQVRLKMDLEQSGVE